jgi:2-deoxy-D-gluconate 3-dehydrogenase
MTVARQDLFSLQGRCAIVTGASRGIGAAIATALAAHGAHTILVARGSCAATAAAISSAGGKAACLQADLAGAASRAGLWPAIDALGLRPDILVNNAGIIRRADCTEHADDDWHAVLETNLTAAFDLSRTHAARLRAAGKPGRIVNVLSLLSFQGGIRVAAYTAAKTGLLGLTRAMANELAPHGINVNGIVPGYIATENTAALRADSEREQAIRARIPAGRWGAPEDLQGAAVFLCAPAADYVHGATITVDGGWLAR